VQATIAKRAGLKARKYFDDVLSPGRVENLPQSTWRWPSLEWHRALKEVGTISQILLRMKKEKKSVSLSRL